MSVIIGSARIDERGRASGGIVGDQKQVSTPDYKGEVSMQTFYVPSGGWNVARLIDPSQAGRCAASMQRACNNKHIGYDQGNRYAILNVGTATTKDTECDCSSLVRQCVKEATGIDPGDFTTGTEISKLKATGLFETFAYSSNITLCTGDILVTKTKGHTVIVTSGNSRAAVKNATGGNKMQAALKKDSKYNHEYRTTTSLYMRYGAGKDYGAVTILPANAKVRCYGYYNIASNGTPWLYILGPKGEVGYSSSKYLKEVK